MKRTIHEIDDKTRLVRDDSPWVLKEIIAGNCGLAKPKAATLAIADPPYNSGEKYAGFDDRWQSKQQYWEWCERWLRSLAGCVADNGSVWVLTPPETTARLRVYAEDQLELKCQEIIWHYRFGQHTLNRFIPSHTNWLWITNPTTKTRWYPDKILVDSDRIRYGDTRIAQSPRKGKRVPLDVWAEFPRIQGNNRERQAGSPNQIPEAMIMLIIQACSKKGDLIIDPFAGTGTVGTVARALGRQSLSIEISPQIARKAAARIKRGPARIDY